MTNETRQQWLDRRGERGRGGYREFAEDATGGMYSSPEFAKPSFRTPTPGGRNLVGARRNREEEVQKAMAAHQQGRHALGIPTVQVPGTKGIFNDPNPITNKMGTRLSWLNQPSFRGGPMGVDPNYTGFGGGYKGSMPTKRPNTMTDEWAPVGKAWDLDTGELVDEEIFPGTAEYEYSSRNTSQF